MVDEEYNINAENDRIEHHHNNNNNNNKKIIA
jgi:hypothetical protein